MSNENKPDWNDLQNEQAETSAWQIDKIWATAKKLPVYFWVMALLLIALIGLTLQQNKIIKNMTKATNKNTMMNEAYHTIAMNSVPLNLQQYLDVASDEQWAGYAQMAVERNSYNVIKTIASIPELMKMETVASIVNDYSQAMELADHNK